ncbi:hypothetical protein LSH36_534g01014 [Paralvinella palmiformis]|uniref:Fork-head domain-containing protein n=1 Tax=Paralvinella palmiformis TaxID=53620 RepID=A0AAD9J8H5_9ANNE|nr:hypothetical protein LSH36_534g01014 [Paralvinella palmiformis]
MTTMRDVMTTKGGAQQQQQQQQQQQPQQPQQQPLLSVDSCLGYGQVGGYNEENRMWSTPQKPSWTDIHDIVRSSSSKVNRRLDRNQNAIEADSFLRHASGLRDDVAAVVAPILTVPVGNEDRKRRRYEELVPELPLADVERSPPEELEREIDGTGSDLFTSIARAILQASGGEILLGEIYGFMAANYAIFKNDVYKNWRVRVRHVLSVNSCFVKGKRAKSGRGFYWMIHPACVDSFRSGDISKRRAAQLVKRWQKQQSELEKERSRIAQCTPRATGESTFSDSRCPDGYVIPDRTAHHQRVYTPMTTVELSEYDYYELLMNLSDGRKQH